MLRKVVDSRLYIAGVRLDGAQKSEVLRVLGNVLVCKVKREVFTVVTVNPEQVVQAQTDDSFRYILNSSSLSLMDGVGLVWAKWILGLTNKKWRSVRAERVTGIEVAEELIRFCGENNLRVFLLGGREGVGERAVRVQISNLKSQNQNVNLKAIACAGAFNVQSESEEERRETLDRIRKFKPQLLLVAYGAPWQEKWVWENREELTRVGVKVAMVVGGAFDIWAGKVKRSPALWRKMGLEWLWRMIWEPWRWKRQLRLLEFVRLVVRQRMVGNRID